MASIGAVDQAIPHQGMEECCIDTHMSSLISLVFMHNTHDGLRIKTQSSEWGILVDSTSLFEISRYQLKRFAPFL